MRLLRAFPLVISILLGFMIPVRAQSKVDPRLSLTRDLMDEMASGHFASFCDHLSPQLKESITDDRLEFVWKRLTAVSGAFENQISQSTRAVGGVSVYVSKSQFESSKVELRLMFNSANQITHFWIAPVSDLSPERMEASAKEAANLLGQSHFDQLNARFDDVLKDDMPPERLAMSWSHVMAHLGPFKHVKLAVKDPELDTVDVRCEFEHGDMIVRVGFGPSGKISGLWMVPVESELPATPDI
jgi:Protein of unknown function (DUF3887)